jgi:hypothetical protein
LRRCSLYDTMSECHLLTVPLSTTQISLHTCSRQGQGQRQGAEAKARVEWVGVW